MKFTERNIQRAIWSRYNGGWLVACNNIYLYRHWESDLLAVTASGYTVEYEIKLSVADFIADSKKIQKHINLVNGHGPNRFYYVVPEGLISDNVVPSYAGLLYAYDEGDWIYVDNMAGSGQDRRYLKSAKRVHSNKINEREFKKISQSLYWRYWRSLNED